MNYSESGKGAVIGIVDEGDSDARLAKYGGRGADKEGESAQIDEPSEEGADDGPIPSSTTTQERVGSERKGSTGQPTTESSLLTIRLQVHPYFVRGG